MVVLIIFPVSQNTNGTKYPTAASFGDKASQMADCSNNCTLNHQSLSHTVCADYAPLQSIIPHSGMWT